MVDLGLPCSLLSALSSEDFSNADISHSAGLSARGQSQVGFVEMPLLQELSQYVRGWMGYFCLEHRKTMFQGLDKWLRRRVRACYWKWWRLAKTKIRKLLQLGINRDEALNHGYSRKGPWRMSGSRAVHMALSITWLNAQGLLSLEVLGARFAPKR